MGNHRRRFLYILAALPVILVTVALSYQAGMAIFEDEPRTFWRALEWASETLTTTGYGADARWQHPVMILFVILLQFLGVFLVYMLVPVVMLPLLESRFERRLPRKAPKKLREHVVIFSYGAAVETLIEELIDSDVPLLVIELDDDRARDLLEQWQDGNRYRQAHLINGPTLRGCFEEARLEAARAVVANGGDEENAIAVMIAQELGFTGKKLAVAEDPHHQQPLQMAGATAVLTPRHVLGYALAARASQDLHPRVDGVQQLGPNVQVAEIRVHRGSELVGRTLRETNLGRRTGVTVIGQWQRGVLDAEPKAETRIEARGLLVAIGESQAIEKLSDLAGGGHMRRQGPGPFLIAGYGEVGQKVAQQLREVGESVVIIDKNPDHPDVDVVGDIGQLSTLEGLDLDGARGLVLALDSDSATLFATLIIKDRAPSLPTIARVNHASNLERIYRAGADFALSIAQVSAQILVHELTGRDILALDAQLKILRLQATKLADQHLSALELRRHHGCSIVAIERGDQVITRLDPEQQFQPEDTIYVCGPHSATERFAERFA